MEASAADTPRVPDYLQEVEYIESTTAGTDGQYLLLTGVSISANVPIEIHCKQTENSSSYIRKIFACATGGSVYYYKGAFGYHNKATKIRDSMSSPYDTTVFSFSVNSSAPYVFRSNPSQTQHFKGRIFSIVASTGSVTELDLIPCYRISDGEIGMYDAVSKQFYTNQGSGSFTKGADVT